MLRLDGYTCVSAAVTDSQGLEGTRAQSKTHSCLESRTVNPRRLEDKSLFLKSLPCSALGYTREEQRRELGAQRLGCGGGGGGGAEFGSSFAARRGARRILSCPVLSSCVTRLPGS